MSSMSYTLTSSISHTYPLFVYNQKQEMETHLTVSEDITDSIAISVSSAPEMADSLTDGSTETFWESDCRVSFIQLTFLHGTVRLKLAVLCDRLFTFCFSLSAQCKPTSIMTRDNSLSRMWRCM